MAFGEIFLAGATGSPERARQLHLARSGSQSQRAIWFILPARGASHIISKVIDLDVVIIQQALEAIDEVGDLLKVKYSRRKIDPKE